MDSSPSNQNINQNGNQQQDDRGKRKVTSDHDASGATSQPRKKILPPRSNVWAHYTRGSHNRNKCICNYCKHEYSCNPKSGTSNLITHLLICKQYKAWVEGEASIQPIINEEGGLKDAKVTKEVFKEASNEMLVLGELPLAFIESVAWKYFCNKVGFYD